jgi:secreted PhoX family phosphatase
MSLTRRQLLVRGGFGAGVLLAGPAVLPTRTAFAAAPDVFGYGALVPDPSGLLDLPRGFSYRTLSRTGDLMADGARVPAGHDGMAAFPGRDGETVLVRNHELSPGSATAAVTAAPYDPRCTGGTTNVVVDDDGALVTHYASLAGTFRNCAGGATPWHTWLTCEENDSHPATSSSVSKPHGYVFEVDPYAPPSSPPVPLTAMGRFAHEAVAVDPAPARSTRRRTPPGRTAASTGSARGSRAAAPAASRPGESSR